MQEIEDGHEEGTGTRSSKILKKSQFSNEHLLNSEENRYSKSSDHLDSEMNNSLEQSQTPDNQDVVLRSTLLQSNASGQESIHRYKSAELVA